MTAFLRRLVAQAGVGGGPARVPAGAVRPLVAARFEPSGAGADATWALHEVEHEATGDKRPAACGPAADAGRPPGQRRFPEALQPPAGVRPSGDERDGVRTVPAPAAAPAREIPGPRAAGPRHPGPLDRATLPPSAATAAPAPAGPVIPRRPAPAEEPRATRATPSATGENAALREQGPALPPVPLRPARRAEPLPAPVRAGPRAGAERTAGDTERPVVHVTIGRVEIRTAPPAARHWAMDAQAVRPDAGASALEEYLGERAGAGDR